MHWSVGYIGIPFAERGYGRAGCSCWGLLWLVQREVFGREIPRHDEPVANFYAGRDIAEGIFLAGALVEPVTRTEAREGDALHMWGYRNGKRTRMHVGVLAGPNHVLHSELTTGAVVSDLRREEWRWIEAYRFV